MHCHRNPRREARQAFGSLSIDPNCCQNAWTAFYAAPSRRSDKPTIWGMSVKEQRNATHFCLTSVDYRPPALFIRLPRAALVGPAPQSVCRLTAISLRNSSGASETSRGQWARGSTTTTTAARKLQSTVDPGRAKLAILKKRCSYQWILSLDTYRQALVLLFKSNQRLLIFLKHSPTGSQ